jgi:gamma-glutamylcyclotransferase (GGCT)/AIG2-like uncharacterized protein YtfP
MKKVFVYGTLKQGGRFHPALEGCEFLGNKTLKGFEMYDFHGSYPIVIKGDKDSKIHGEVYRVPAEVESILDQIEGYPHLYQKHVVKDMTLYIFEDPKRVKGKFERIKDGVWHN